MKKTLFLSLLVLTVAIPCPLPAEEADPPENSLSLWYRKPAGEWTEALPVGNGRMGGMVFGGVAEERIQFNEDTLWTGQPQDYQHEGAVDHLPTIRQLLFDGKRKEAETLAMKEFMSVPLRQEAYQPFGDLMISFPGHEQSDGYRRDLDLEKAVASVSYRSGGTAYRREVFASYPDNVIVVKLTADQPGKITFSAGFTSQHTESSTAKVSDDTLALKGRVTRQSNAKTESVMRFESRVQARVEGGGVEASDEEIRVKGADSVVLLLAAETSYVNYEDVSGDPGSRCAETLAAVKEKPAEKILADHQADYRELFDRVEIDLGTSPAVEMETDERVKAFKGGNDPQLISLLFQYGRYLLIACSRKGGQTANLQGLWNDRLSPPWGSKYTININIEMNYWPAELTNLSECHEPLFDMLEECAVTGRKTAKTFYGCDGWVLHHNTDIWRGSAPINKSNHGIWVTGSGWLVDHFWMRWDFTRDREFLEKRAYPIMKQAATFYLDFLIEDPRSEKKWLISTPSHSPENGGLVAGPTMDHQIIRTLFRNCVEASRILGVDEDFRKRLEETIPRIAPNQIGQHGQLQEWLEDIDNPKNRHRHVSHLWGLHPGPEITRRGTPDLWKAARQSLIFRGDEATGWSMGWKINFWARFEDGDHAMIILNNLVTLASTKTKKSGLYPNLFDAHPPFQIDGNFGACAGVAEMLLQSHAGEIHLLPALPSVWPTGSIRGLVARGAYEVDIAWKDGRLSEATIRSRKGGAPVIRYGEKTLALEMEEGAVRALSGDLEIR